MRNLFIALACLITACTEVHHHYHGVRQGEPSPGSGQVMPATRQEPEQVTHELPVEDQAISSTTSVIIPGIESIDFDDSEVNHFNMALRAAAGDDLRLELEDPAPSIGALVIASGECDPFQALCLRRLADVLRPRAENFIFGIMHRRHSNDGYVRVVELSRYDMRRDAIVTTHDLRLPQDPTVGDMRRAAREAIRSLFPEPNQVPMEEGPIRYVAL